VKQRNGLPAWIKRFTAVVTVLPMALACAFAQDQAPSAEANPNAAMTAAIMELQEQVKELRAAVSEIRTESAQYRAQAAELKRALEIAQGHPATPQTPGGADNDVNTAEGAPGPASARSKSLSDRIAALEDSVQLLNGKTDEQYQTKVESASKYKVRLSGIVLMNLFSNRGVVDNQDFPSLANQTDQLSGNGSFGATVRQSEIGLEVFGPTIANARTSATLQADFAGAFPVTRNGVNYGQFRLRTANVRMDWQNTSIVAGQDELFISPSSPTSLASLAVPAFNYAGNLWGWVPQLRVEQRYQFKDNQTVTLQGGILDSETGEYPGYGYDRTASAGERSGQPAYGARVSWTTNVLGQRMSLGTAGYYGRQDWQFGRHVDSWAGMADWEIPLATKLSLSGEFYRGRAVGGLGGGIGRSVGSPADPQLAGTPIYGLDSLGGWSQLKLRATPKLEFNTALGVDSPYASEIRSFAASPVYGPLWTQNASAFVNFIYRPRSDLILSTEYRKLRTLGLAHDRYDAGQVNLGMGILF
jgi:hypothetical protein